MYAVEEHSFNFIHFNYCILSARVGVTLSCGASRVPAVDVYFGSTEEKWGASA